MGYRYKADIAVDKILMFNEGDYIWQIQLQDGAKFKLADCYFTVQKFDDEGLDISSDGLMVEYYTTNKDKKIAYHKICEAVTLIVFLSDIPFDLPLINEIDFSNDDNTLDNPQNEAIDKIDKRYSIEISNKELLIRCLHLYYASQRLYCVEQIKDSFFAFFEILELIANNEFKMKKNNIDEKKESINSIIAEAVKANYKVKLTENQVKKVVNIMTNTIFNDTYSKIDMFINMNNIDIDEEVISSIVKLRNQIAHGSIVSIEKDKTEYTEISRLAKDFIKKKFFIGIDTVEIMAEKRRSQYEPSIDDMME